MRLRRAWLALPVAVAAMLAIIVSPNSANAIVGGTDDTTNRFQNVGMLQLRSQADWFAFCSGTLVAPTVVLTAAHCTDFFTAAVGQPGLGPDDLRVSFAVAPDENSTYYVADHVVVNPDWLTAPACLGNSKHLCLAPPAEDIALIFLEQTVLGVAPAAIAGPGYLDGLDLTAETFTVVGYGTDAFITGSAGAPNAITTFDGVRSYRDVTSITTARRVPRSVREDHQRRVLWRLRRSDVPREQDRRAEHVDVQLSVRRTEPRVPRGLRPGAGVPGHLPLIPRNRTEEGLPALLGFAQTAR